MEFISAALKAFAWCASFALADSSGDAALSIERLLMLVDTSKSAHTLSRLSWKSSGPQDEESSSNCVLGLKEHAVWAVRVSLEALKVLSDSR
jgi:hypothetical protein